MSWSQYQEICEFHHATCITTISRVDEKEMKQIDIKLELIRIIVKTNSNINMLR
jgi:hypothetical protein